MYYIFLKLLYSSKSNSCGDSNILVCLEFQNIYLKDGLPGSISLQIFLHYYFLFLHLGTFDLPEINASTVQSVVGPDCGEKLLVVTRPDLFNKAFLKLPSNGDPHQL